MNVHAWGELSLLADPADVAGVLARTVKAGQNRAAEDQFGATEVLETSGEIESAALAAFARRHLGHRAAR